MENVINLQKVCIILVSLLMTTNVLSQNIKGKVFSLDDGKPLFGATIKVLYKDSLFITGFTTDKDGRFSYDIELDDYKLEISYIGYKKNVMLIRNSEKTNMDLGVIQLTSTTVDLKGIEITAIPMIHKADKIVVFPNTKQVNASMSSLDLLQNLLLPNLIVDPIQEKISIQGTSGVIYRINGIKASFDEIKGLKPEQIQRIDYRPTPYIRELDTNSGSIDFILKKMRTGTSLSTNALSAVNTGMINGSINMRTNFKKSQFALDYSINYRDYSKRKTSEVEKLSTPNEELEWDRKGEYAPFGYTQHNIALGYLFKGEKNVINIRFNNFIYSQHNNNLMEIYQNGDRVLNRKIHSTFSNYIPSIDFTYSRQLNKKQGFEFNLVGTLSNNDYERKLSEVDIRTNGQSEINNISDGHQKSIISEAYYWNEGEKSSFSAGIKSAYQYTQNIYFPNNEIIIQNLELYPYLQFSSRINQISYTIGTGIKSQLQSQSGKKTSYLRNISSLSLSYLREKWNLKYSMNYRTFFPSISSLSEITQTIDAFSLTKGNSKLEPFSNWKNQLDYTVTDNKCFISILTLVASKSFNPIQQDIIYSSNENKFIYQENNQKYDLTYGAQLIMQVSNIAKLFTIQAFGGWNYYKSKGDLYEHYYNDYYYGFYIGMNYKKFSINTMWRKPQKYLSGQYLTTSENNSSIGISYKADRLNIGLGVQYPFSSGAKYRTERLAENSFLDRKVLIKNNANMFYLNLSYNINWGRSIFQSYKRLQNSDNTNNVIKINDN